MDDVIQQISHVLVKV